MTAEELKQRIIHLNKEVGISYAHIARKSGISVSRYSLYKWEKGLMNLKESDIEKLKIYLNTI